MANSIIHNKEMVDWLLRGARAGGTYEDCGDMIGISGATVSRWVSRGESAIEEAMAREELVSEDDWVYAQFYLDFKQARAVARVGVLEDLRDHQDWRAKVQWLARTSDHYKDVDKKQIEITGANGGPLELGVLVSDAVRQLDDADRLAEERRIAEYNKQSLVEGHIVDKD